MLDADAVAVAENNKRLGPGSSASGLLTDPKPIPKTNSQTLDVPAITNLNLIPSVPVLPRPPYRFHPGVYSPTPGIPFSISREGRAPITGASAGRSLETYFLRM